MDKIVKAIHLLGDGKWHKISELKEELKLDAFKTKLLVNFLINYDFCVQCGSDHIKMKQDIIDFFKRLGEVG